MKMKVFNYSELHFSELNSFKIHTLGKTPMLMVYSQDEFPAESVATVFDNFVTSIVVYGKPYRLGLWDTAGQEGYERLRMVSYPLTVTRIYK